MIICFVYVCACVFVYVCVSVCVCTCVCICVYACAYMCYGCIHICVSNKSIIIVIIIMMIYHNYYNNNNNNIIFLTTANHLVYRLCIHCPPLSMSTITRLVITWCNYVITWVRRQQAYAPRAVSP